MKSSNLISKNDLIYKESKDFVNQFLVNSQKNKTIKAHSKFCHVSIIASKSNQLNEYFHERQRLINRFHKFLIKPLKTDVNLSLDSFKLVQELGTGGYGSVFLAHSIQTNQYLALKALKKSTLIESDEQNIVLTERQYTYALEHPNIVKFLTSFQDNEYVYLGFEWLQGGDLYSLMSYQKLTELQAQFYAAQIVLALDYIHECKIVFRDLKPENIVFTQNGYIKLVDLGLSKIIRGYTNTFCGTPHYIAPEIIMQRPYTTSPDYWALGIIIHEMITGDAPYDRTHRTHTQTIKTTMEDNTSDIIRPSSKHYNMYLRVINGCSSMKLESMTKSCSLILRGLLRINIDERLGCGQRRALDLIEHPWFEKINFWNMYRQTYLAPFIPICKYLIQDEYNNETLLKFTAKNQYERQFIDF